MSSCKSAFKPFNRHQFSANRDADASSEASVQRIRKRQNRRTSEVNIFNKSLLLAKKPIEKQDHF